MTRQQYDRLVADLNAHGSSAILRPGPLGLPQYHLPRLERGSDRDVYLLEVEGYEPTVLKVEHHGNAQTTVEVACASTVKSPLVPKVYDWGPSSTHPKWVEMELLVILEDALADVMPRGMRRPKDDPFWRATGVTFGTFDLAINVGPRSRGVWLGKHWKDFETFMLSHSTDRKLTARFIEDLRALVASCHLDPSELAFEFNWGFDARGRLKIADLGGAVHGGVAKMRHKMEQHGNPGRRRPNIEWDFDDFDQGDVEVDALTQQRLDLTAQLHEEPMLLVPHLHLRPEGVALLAGAPLHFFLRSRVVAAAMPKGTTAMAKKLQASMMSPRTGLKVEDHDLRGSDVVLFTDEGMVRVPAKKTGRANPRQPSPKRIVTQAIAESRRIEDVVELPWSAELQELLRGRAYEEEEDDGSLYYEQTKDRFDAARGYGPGGVLWSVRLVKGRANPTDRDLRGELLAW